MKRRDFLRMAALLPVAVAAAVPATLEPLQVTISCDPSQFIESLRLAEEEIARIFKVPVRLLDHTPRLPLKAAQQAWLDSEEQRILYGIREHHRPMGLLDCRSLKTSLGLVVRSSRTK